MFLFALQFNILILKASFLKYFLFRQVVKLQAEQVQVTELSKKNELAREALEKLKVCEEELKTLTGQKEKFERMYIKANGNYSSKQ